MSPCVASLDEAPRCRRCWRGCCALSYVTFDYDPPAEGALPADGYGMWDVVGGQDLAVIGVMAAARHVYLLGSITRSFFGRLNFW